VKSRYYLEEPERYALQGGTMSRNIFVLDAKKGAPQTMRPLTFVELDVQERRDLEEWIKANPAILGTNLLIVSTEYDRFDKSDKRLDLLAIDEDGKLVVIELKRDASGTLADLQALRYAAFCSLLQLRDVVALRAEFTGADIADVETEIKQFIKNTEFKDFDNKPRIILAAGGFDDQELTSCILWLREFNVGITCVEITPYRDPSNEKIILVPRVIIPLPEAKDFIVGKENKEATQGEPSAFERQNFERNRSILDAFGKLMPDRAPSRPSGRLYMQIATGHGHVHFEWLQRGRGTERSIDVALHSETEPRELNRDLCLFLEKRAAEIACKVGEKPLFDSNWTRPGWSSVYFRRNFSEWNQELARWSAETMNKFFKVAQPLVDEFYLNQ
jgi:hypothetical protein